jgi:glycosyltransferase involved in cell wall biosynthesis
MAARRILYVQYADPAAYPPIEHSSSLLAQRGWEVTLLGTDAFSDRKLHLPPHPRVQAKYLSSRGPRALAYVRFLLLSMYWIWTWRPTWVYVSDPLALPAMWVARLLTRARMVYHEHDAPDPERARSRFMKSVLACRRRLGKAVELCIVPQYDRLLDFLTTTGRTGPAICVWNCPSLREVRTAQSDTGDYLTLWYHGSINSARLPRELVIAASRFRGAARIRIAGYETPGSIGYVQELMDLASKYGATGLVQFLGTIPRAQCLSNASNAVVGLSLMPKASQDINLRHMVGASNKAFEYMACALPLLVTNSPEWESVFVEPCFARACDPTDVDAIEDQLRWFIEHPDERREMGRRGADKIKRDWNYERLFASALAFLEGDSDPVSNR